MKYIQLLALIVALPLSTAFAQQEIDPDHFDAPAAKPAIHKTQVQHLSGAHRSHQVRTASRHKAHSHHGRVSA